MNETAAVLAALKSDSAKTRERAVKNLSPAALQDSQIIDALQNLVGADPVEYVRDAARAQLLAAGQTPRASAAPIQVKQEGAGKPAIFALGCMAIPIACVVIALFVIAILALLGPQIGSVFSRVTSGLGPP